MSADLIEWADVVFVMESIHKRKLNHNYAALLRERRVIVPGIADNYEYMEEKLISVLSQAVTPYLHH